MPVTLPPDWDDFLAQRAQEPTPVASAEPKAQVQLPPDFDTFVAQKTSNESKFMSASDFDYQAGRLERQERKKQAGAVEVERSLPEEIGASVVRGALGIAKLPVQMAKFVGADVLGSETIERATVPLIESLEETAESPAWKPSKAAGGAPIDLDRIISSPGEVIGQITSQITNPNFWAAQLPEGAMSMIPAIVGAWAPRAVAYAGKLGTALEAAKAAGDAARVAEIGKKINRLSTIGMYGMSMAMEAGQGEEKVRDYEERTGERIPWGSRVASILGTGVIAGGLEAFSLGRVLPSALLGRKGTSPLSVIENVLNGRSGREIVNKVLAGVATEGLTEGAQTIVENAFPKHFFDKNQKLLEGVVESMLIGAALGGMGGGAEAISTHREAGAFARESGEFSQDFQDAVTRIQEAKRLAEEEYWSQVRPILPEKPDYTVQNFLGVPRPEAPPPGETPIVDEFGRPARTPERTARYEAIMAKQPWEQTAEDRGFLSSYQRELGVIGKTITAPTETPAGPGLIVPAAFGGPRPMASTGYETMQAGQIAPPNLGERVQQLTAAVEESGDPNAARELNQLLVANQKEIGDLFRVPEREIPGLEPIADRLESLIRRVEETGDPEAARELHGLLAANRDVLSGVTRREVAERSGLPPAPMGVTAIAAADVGTPPRAPALPTAITGTPRTGPTIETALRQPTPVPTEGATEAAPRPEGPPPVEPGIEPTIPEGEPTVNKFEYPPSWRHRKEEFLGYWDDDEDSGVIYRNEDGDPEATWSREPQGIILQKGEDGPFIKNPDTGDIYFDNPDEAKKEYHRQEVLRAYRAGEKVPAKILEEYPEHKQGYLTEQGEAAPAKPLPSAITGTGPASKAKPVKHPGIRLPKGIAPKPATPVITEISSPGAAGATPGMDFRIYEQRDGRYRLEKMSDTGHWRYDSVYDDLDSVISQIKERGGILEDVALVSDIRSAREFIKEFDKKVKEPLEKSEKPPKIEPKGQTPPEGESHDNANRPKDQTGNDKTGAQGQVPGDVSGTGKERDPGAVPPGEGQRDDGGIHGGPARSDTEGSEGRSGEEGLAEVNGGREPSPEPADRRSAGDVAGVPDYRIQPGEIKRTGGWKATAARNLDIIQLVKQLEKEGRQATPEEQALLVQYTGMGASEIANNLFPGLDNVTGAIRPEWARDEGWKQLSERVQQLLTPEEIKAAAKSTQYAHYTSQAVIHSIYRALEKFGFPGGNVLEPGMGTGLFAGIMPEGMKDGSTYTGIEMDNITAAIAKHLFPQSNIIHGDYIKQAFPDNFFDMAIGNPPFASTVILADPKYSKHRFKLHDYFFAKTIDKVRPGGLMVFISSRFTMDKQGDRARKYLADRADLIGAIRLPQTAFKENAGTEVVTDVIFLRKRAEGEAPGGHAWMELREVQTAQGPIDINEYFADNPDMVLGTNSLTGSMYRKNEYTVTPKAGNIEDHFAAAVENLPDKVYSIVKRPADAQRHAVIEKDFNPKNKKEGGVYLDDDGNLMIVEQGAGVSLTTVNRLGKTRDLKTGEIAWLKDYVELRDAVKQAQYDQLNDGPWADSLKAVNQVYDRFVKKHGRIGQFTLIDKTKEDEDGNITSVAYRKYKNSAVLSVDVEAPIVEAIESTSEDGKISKGNFLQGRTIQKPVPIQPQTPHEALAVTLDELGVLNLDAIAGKLNITRDETIDALGGLVFDEPAQGWKLADEYLSGNVVKKLEEARAAARIDKKYERNATALEKVQPKPLAAKDITAFLGAPWIPEQVVRDFASEVLGINSRITYRRNLAIWVVPGSQTRAVRTSATQWGTSDRSPYEILSSVLNNTTIRVTRTEIVGGRRTTVLDRDATTAIAEIGKQMKAAFGSWVWTDAKRAGALLNIYNHDVNNLVGRQFDGSHLTLPGLTITFPLHDHQKRAVWRAIQAGNSYFAHAVGAGKTLEMICAGMEMVRLGLISKPMYVVPNHMLGQFSSEFLQAYPLANIMVADENSFHTSNRRRFMAQAAINKPDAIIVTHSALGLLGMQPENVTSVRDQFIRDLQEQIDILRAEDEKGNWRLIKKVQARIDQLTQRFDKLINSNTDRALSFEEMGVDFLFVDEAHEFRKLDFVTNRTAKGIDSNGSQKAMGLYLKTLWLNSRRPGRSHIFASGTPITNTMAELYTLQRFFDRDVMEEEGIAYFDAWANMFGEIAPNLEMNAAGNYEQIERFARFCNIPELMKRVRKFMDVLTFSQLAGYAKIPKIKGGKPNLVVTKKLKALQDYQRDILQPRIDISRRTPPPNTDPIINIITDGRLASIDMRFVTSAPNDPDTKLNRMIDGIIEAYNEGKNDGYLDEEGRVSQGSTQLVFYNHGFGAGVIARRGFNSREFLMDRLKEAGVPASEIAWIDDFKTATQKESVFKKMRQGKIRILIGSAKKMGTGMNVQNRLKYLQYLDPPWYPADVEQPLGRILRQGNQNETVTINLYATEGSYDSTMWQMVSMKSRFQEQAFEGDESVREISDISAASQYQMMSAATSGDPRAMQRAGLGAEVEKLNRLYTQHIIRQRELESDKGQAERDKLYWEGRLKALKVAEKATGGQYYRELKGTVGTETFDKRADFGAALKTAYNTAVGEQVGKPDPATIKIGTVHGFDIVAQTRPISFGNPPIRADLVVRLADNVEEAVERDNYLGDETDAGGLATRIVNGLNSIPDNVRKAEKKIRDLKAHLQSIERHLGAPFEHEQELERKIAELARLEEALRNEGHVIPPQDITAAIAATRRTGPTIATAMRRPTLPAGIAPKYRVTQKGEGAPITLQSIQQSIGGVKVQEIEGDKGFHLTLPSGGLMVILTGQNLTANRAEMLMTYGREMRAGEWVAGEWKSMSVGGVMALAKGAGTLTLNHEFLHAAADLVLTQKELDRLLKDHGDWEAAARAYEVWEPAKGPDNPLFRKIWNFFRRLARLLRPNTTEAIFERIRSGEVWVRTQAGPGTGQTGVFNALRSDAETVLTQYHRDLMAQDPGSKSLWRRFWDKDPALKASWTEMSQKAYDQVVDRFAPGERAQEKLAKAGVTQPAGEQFTSTIGFWRGQEGWNHEAVLGAGVYYDPVETAASGASFFSGAEPTRVGDSLFKRVDPIRALAKTRDMENKEVFRDLRLLMAAQRDLELAGETGTRAPGEIKGVRPDESRAALEALETKYGDDFSQLQEVADSIRDWADQAILQRLLQGGIISQDLYNKIKAKNQAYIPFMRLMDELDSYIKSTGGGKVIKEIKGSERAIVDPFQMLIELSAKANYAYAKNRMIRSLYQMGQASPEMGVKELKPKIVPSGMVLKDKWEPLGRSGWAIERELPNLKKGYAFSPLPPEPGAIPFYRDGKRSWLKLPPDLYGMTQNLLPEDLGLLMRVLKWPADVLRTGAVTTPEFGLIKNPLRDLIQAWLFNRAGFSPLKWFRDLYLTLSKNPATMKMRAEMAAGGGFMATLAQSTVNENITAEDIEGKKKNIAYVAHPVEALRKLSAYLENLTRFSLYKQARENGLSHAEAIHEARRTTLDFRRLGAHPVARYLNMIIPFWNANIQGVDKLVTELRGPNKAAVMRRLGTLAAASIGLALLFRGDDRLKELEDWEKNYFWHIPLGKDGPIIRLPKPFEAGILFGSVPERLVEVAMGDNTTGLKAAVKAAVDALTPETIPAILRPLVELKSNYNFFLGRPIEDVSLQSLPVELRSKPWTTPLAKALSAHGGNLIGLSPVKIEHFVRSFSGGLGANYYFPGADLVLRKAGVLEDLPNPQQSAIERAFGIRALFTKPPAGYRAKSVGDFFENVQSVTQADQGWKLLWNTGSMDKLDAFLQKNPEAMFARIARKQMAEIGKIKKERNAIHGSRTLTAAEKRAKLDALDERIVNIAKSGNAIMDPGVAQALKMPARVQTEGGAKKSLDLDGYYKMVVESVGDAYDRLRKDLPRLLRMDEAQRQRHLIKVFRQAREEYRPILKRPEEVATPYRFSDLFDKPTRKERATWQQTMGFRKSSAQEITGYRLKQEEREVQP